MPAEADDEFWDAEQVAAEAGYTGPNRRATARKVMSRLGISSTLRHNERGRAQAYYPADAVRKALSERPGHPTGGGRKLTGGET
ncbi:hypothetical protein [Streptomyces drozdowiczii]|uniref:hypothetical protein n=1 Tax=Streptomyces drozdowiczii TaxID=202862 RepID=UPI00403CBF18